MADTRSMEEKMRMGSFLESLTTFDEQQKKAAKDAKLLLSVDDRLKTSYFLSGEKSIQVSNQDKMTMLNLINHFGTDERTVLSCMLGPCFCLDGQSQLTYLFRRAITYPQWAVENAPSAHPQNWVIFGQRSIANVRAATTNLINCMINRHRELQTTEFADPNNTKPIDINDPIHEFVASFEYIMTFSLFDRDSDTHKEVQKIYAAVLALYTFYFFLSQKWNVSRLSPNLESERIQALNQHAVLLNYISSQASVAAQEAHWAKLMNEAEHVKTAYGAYRYDRLQKSQTISIPSIPPIPVVNITPDGLDKYKQHILSTQLPLTVTPITADKLFRITASIRCFRSPGQTVDTAYPTVHTTEQCSAFVTKSIQDTRLQIVDRFC